MKVEDTTSFVSKNPSQGTVDKGLATKMSQEISEAFRVFGILVTARKATLAVGIENKLCKGQISLSKVLSFPLYDVVEKKLKSISVISGCGCS